MAQGSLGHWAGVVNDSGSFGSVVLPTSSSSRSPTSLVAQVLTSRSPVVLLDAVLDARYVAAVDGIVAPRTPLLIVPIFGRSNPSASTASSFASSSYGGVVGVLWLCRARTTTANAGGYTSAEVHLAEQLAALLALQLYWCHGLGSVHAQLVKTAKQVEGLEQLQAAQRSRDPK